MAKKWYVIHTQTGFEARVKEHLDQRIKLAGKEDSISQILIPTENVSEVKDGKKRVSVRKFFPGYVLVEMEMSDENWYIVRNTPGVTGFIGSANKPTEINQEDIEKILRQSEEKKAKVQPKVAFEKGENIKIIEGPFMSFNGVIEEIYPDKGKLKVMVSIFGRSTPVELEYWQVEKI
ncbi:transcription termination/antitermination protein NusG [bacterium]|nr:transcription termination/antitermination protein NusG [bacterium]